MARLTSEEFFRRCNDKHHNKYNYDKTIFNTTRDKIVVTCLHHGDFTVLADNHMRTSGCPKCGTLAGAKHTTVSYDEFIERLKDANITNLSFNRDEYVNFRTPIHVTCNKHKSVFIQKPHNICKGHIGCTQCVSEKISSKTRNNTSKFVSMSKALYGDRFKYDKVNYTTNVAEVELICKDHGSFFRSPKVFLRGYHCSECMKNDIFVKNGELFKHKFNEDWTKYNLKSQYCGTYQPIIVECPDHGEFEVTPEQCRIRAEICEKCRSKNGSKQERVLFEFLENNNINYKPHYKLKTDKTYIELDAFLPDYNIAIEVNGLYWHREQEGTRYTKNYHLNKTDICKENGITLLHFYDTEINEKLHIVQSILRSKLNLNTDRVYARNTQVKYITSNIKKDFLNNYHMQGNDRSSVYLGLYYQDDLVCVMTFGTRKITGSLDHELMRFCVKPNTTVVGGFSKLLKRYRDDFKLITIKTYADRRYSDGNVYQKNGFKFVKYSSPSYWYFNTADYKLLHRYNFAKHTLKDKVLIYDKSLSEREIMKLNNYHRIWDCGQCVYKLD